VLKLKALIGRLRSSHPKYPDVKADLSNRKSGERGENSLDYHLTFLPDKTFYSLHDLRLKNEFGYYFQMDTLLLSHPFTTLLDVKNCGGHVIFDQQFNQLIQISQWG